MDQNDTETLIRILDRAITSDSPEIKQQLQSLLVTVSLVHGGESYREGPLAELVQRVQRIENDHHRLTKAVERLIRENDSLAMSKKRNPYYEEKSYSWSNSGRTYMTEYQQLVEKFKNDRSKD